MLFTLSGKNFFTFKEFYMEFSEKLNVITGESGAGKTLLLKALKAVTGFSPQLTERKEDSYVEATFLMNEALRKRAVEMGIEPSDEILIKVSFGPQRTIYRLNGKITPRQVIAELLSDQIEIHSQHSSVKLLDSSKHHLILDNMIRDRSLLKEYAEKYNEFVKVKKELGSLEVDPGSIAREKDFLEFQLKEILDARLQPGEDFEIERKYKKYTDAQELKKTFTLLMETLKDMDNSAYAILSNILHDLEALEKYGYKDFSEHARVAIEEIDYLYDMLVAELPNFEFDDEEFSQVEARFSLIQNLKRKYGQTVEEIIETGEKIANRLKELTNLEAKKERLVEREKELYQELIRLGKEIDKERLEVARIIKEKIQKHLDDLKMKGAIVDFQFIPNEHPTSSGISKVSLLIRTNPGGGLLEISKVASGGELSRILLAIESVLKDELTLSTVVFDEIDTGVGQRLGKIVAEKVKEISDSVQSIVITHIPQIAAIADRHFTVNKEIIGNNTYSFVKTLSDQERQLELKAMTGIIGEERLYE